MALGATKIEFWRSFFRDSEHGLWTIIDKALTVAALDYPEELRLKRDSIAEKLFSSPSFWELEDGSVCKSQDEATTINEELDIDVYDRGSGSRDESCSYEEKQVLEIKRILLDEDKTDEDVLEGLSKLSKMQLSIETLKSTSIGRPVNSLRKHPSPEIKSMAKQIIRSWKAVADEWAKSSDDVQVFEANDGLQGGLPAPPIDDGELLAALHTPQAMRLVDYVNNGMASGEMDDSPLVQVSYTSSSRASHSPVRISPYNQAREAKTRSNNTAFGERSSSVAPHRKEIFQQKPADASKPTQNLVQKEASMGEYSIRDRLAAAKRKLQEGYQQAENGSDLVFVGLWKESDSVAGVVCPVGATAKKQRVVQVMGLEELPRGSGPKAIKRGGPHAAATTSLRNVPGNKASSIHRR